MTDDPRKAETLDAAARNPNGTYNAIKALSWLSEALAPGRGLTEGQVQQIADEIAAKRAKEEGQ